MSVRAFIVQQNDRRELRAALRSRLLNHPWGKPVGAACPRCVMDASADEFALSGSGCNFCIRAERAGRRPRIPLRLRSGQRVVLGISGGADSSYAAVAAVRSGIRPYLVHVDNGWNSSEGTANVLAVSDGLDLDLETIVVDWPSFRDLQLALFRSGLIDVEMASDHVYVAGVIRTGLSRGYRRYITGQNLATEGILPWSWVHRKTDRLHLRDVVVSTGGDPACLRALPTLSTLSYWMLQRTHFISVDRILDSVEYRRDEAIAEMESSLGWRRYSHKHGESTFTSTYQNVYLPLRFGVDKRRAHLSSEIASGTVTRSQAMSALESPPVDVDRAVTDAEFVCDKLEVGLDQLMAWIDSPPSAHDDFRSEDKIIRRLRGMNSRSD